MNETNENQHNTLVIPRDLWERMRLAIFRISMGRVVCPGLPAYDPGLCDKKAVDKLVEDIQNYDAKMAGKALTRNYSRELSEILDLCESDPRFMEIFKPDLQRLVDLVNSQQKSKL